MATKLSIHAVIPNESAASFVARQRGTTSPIAFIQQLINLFASFLTGVRAGRVRVRVDESTSVAASLTLTAVDYDDGTVGDQLIITVPGEGVPVILTAVASATPAPGTNTYSIATSDNACATSIALAINTSPQLRGKLTAVDSSATVACTAFTKGSVGNGFAIAKKVTTSTFIAGTGQFTGGVDAGALNTAGVTFTCSDKLTANDTLTLGSVVLTAKASPSGESEFAATVSQDADCAALVACINAHSKLKGIYSASYGAAASGIITILCKLEGRTLYQTVLAKSCSVGTLSATTFAPPTVDTWAASSIEYAVGAP